MPRPIQARSAWHRPATEAPLTHHGGHRQRTEFAGPHVFAIDEDMLGNMTCTCPASLWGTVQDDDWGQHVRHRLQTAEFVPGYEASYWAGLGAPKNTPADIVDKLNKEINAGLVDPKLMARFAHLGAAAFPGSSSDFAKFIATETEKWAKVIAFSGARIY